MNKVLKFALGAAVVAPFLLAGVASAATIPATTVFSGQTDVWGNAGSSVTATFRVNVPTGEVVHAIRTKVDSQATVCTEIGPFEGNQDVDVPVTIVLPPNSGAYNLTAELFTTATLPQAEAMTGNLACTGANSNAYNGSNVVHVLPVSGSTSTSGSPTVGSADWMTQLIAALKAALTPPTPAPTPVTSGVCTSFAQASAGSLMNVKNQANVRLQGFLLSQGQDIPALAAGASFGFYGPQTMAAVSSFQAANHCQ